MNVIPWAIPIKAEWHRSIELRQLLFDQDGLSLRVAEEDGKAWDLRFGEIQAMRFTTEESAAPLLASLPFAGGFFEITDSEWLRELGAGRLAYMSHAHHYVVSCYDQVIEIVASSSATVAEVATR
jgi:hypothetical protein